MAGHASFLSQTPHGLYPAKFVPVWGGDSRPAQRNVATTNGYLEHGDPLCRKTSNGTPTSSARRVCLRQSFTCIFAFVARSGKIEELSRFYFILKEGSLSGMLALFGRLASTIDTISFFAGRDESASSDHCGVRLHLLGLFEEQKNTFSIVYFETSFGGGSSTHLFTTWTSCFSYRPFLPLGQQTFPRLSRPACCEPKRFMRSCSHTRIQHSRRSYVQSESATRAVASFSSNHAMKELLHAAICPKSRLNSPLSFLTRQSSRPLYAGNVLLVQLFYTPSSKRIPCTHENSIFHTARPDVYSTPSVSISKTTARLSTRIYGYRSQVLYRLNCLPAHLTIRHRSAARDDTSTTDSALPDEKTQISSL